MGILIRNTQCRCCEKSINSREKTLFEFYYLGSRFEVCEDCFEVEMKKMEILVKAGFETDYEFSEGDSPEKD
jgi:hypothetical protein